MRFSLRQLLVAFVVASVLVASAAWWARRYWGGGVTIERPSIPRS